MIVILRPRVLAQAALGCAVALALAGCGGGGHGHSSKSGGDPNAHVRALNLATNYTAPVQFVVGSTPIGGLITNSATPTAYQNLPPVTGVLTSVNFQSSPPNDFSLGTSFSKGKYYTLFLAGRPDAVVSSQEPRRLQLISRQTSTARYANYASIVVVNAAPDANVTVDQTTQKATENATIFALTLDGVTVNAPPTPYTQTTTVQVLPGNFSVAPTTSNGTATPLPTTAVQAGKTYVIFFWEPTYDTSANTGTYQFALVEDQ